VHALLERAGCEIDVPESERGVQNGHAVAPEMLRTEVLVKFLLYSYLESASGWGGGGAGAHGRPSLAGCGGRGRGGVFDLLLRPGGCKWRAILRSNLEA
jgi:hypothetical protein